MYRAFLIGCCFNLFLVGMLIAAKGVAFSFFGSEPEAKSENASSSQNQQSFPPPPTILSPDTFSDTVKRLNREQTVSTSDQLKMQLSQSPVTPVSPLLPPPSSQANVEVVLPLSSAPFSHAVSSSASQRVPQAEATESSMPIQQPVAQPPVYSGFQSDNRQDAVANGSNGAANTASPSPSNGEEKKGFSIHY